MRCYSPVSIRDPVDSRHFISVPCGKCFNCLSTRRDSWSFRLQVEERHSSSSFFVTLTYSDDNVPYAWSDSHGIDMPVFSKRDCQLFMKRLRKLHPDAGLRYFLVSEYGGQFGRPHYHMILFNMPGFRYQILEDLLRTWDKGIVHVGDVTQASIKYVCKYCLTYESAEDYPERPFMLCSRRPAIGHQYLSKAVVKRFGTCPDYVIAEDGQKLSLPRYYRNKLSPSVHQKELRKLRVDDIAKAKDRNYMKKYGSYDEVVINQGKPSMAFQQISARIDSIRKKMK
ncbi:replication initiator protein [Peromfec virus RodF8_52]|uniref:Replication initiator protein n=1 Tax=Peromfec virus RodF8_52 TaxID=2929381 RepID=A0A976N1Z7_9VIRU|nr:replication initiator protein [Peromfec virus RodF8_52]